MKKWRKWWILKLGGCLPEDIQPISVKENSPIVTLRAEYSINIRDQLSWAPTVGYIKNRLFEQLEQELKDYYMTIIRKDDHHVDSIIYRAKIKVVKPDATVDSIEEECLNAGND